MAAHYMPTFRGAVDGNWNLTVGGETVRTAYTPLLGFYDSREAATVAQHVRWARRYGVSAFMLEWSGLYSPPFTTSFEEPVSKIARMEEFGDINFFFVYSFINALKKWGDHQPTPVDFSDKEIQDKFIGDLRYAAQNYFSMPNHLRIKGKPVIYLWAVTLATGDFDKVIKRLRKTMKREYGFDLYLIGEEIHWGSQPDLSRTPVFDALMPYMMVDPDEQRPKEYPLSDVQGNIIAQYFYWNNVASDLGLDFIPCAFAGFDARGAPWCYDDDDVLTTPLIRRSPKSFKEFVRAAGGLIDRDINMFYVTSWSEWYEGTNIEPSEEFGFAYLKALKKGLAGKPSLKPPASVLRFEFERVFDPDGSGDDRLLATAFDRVEFLDSSGAVILGIDIGASDARRLMGIGWSYDERDWQPAETFVWAGARLKYATLHLDVPQGAARIRITYLQIDNQRTSVYLDSKLLGALPGEGAWQWLAHTLDIPE